MSLSIYFVLISEDINRGSKTIFSKVPIRNFNSNKKKSQSGLRAYICHLRLYYVTLRLKKNCKNTIKVSLIVFDYIHLPIFIHRGCESETDTEEFEKVGQSPLDLHFDKDIPSPKTTAATITKQDAATCTEVGDKSPLPPKKPPRSFQKLHHHDESNSLLLHRTLSVSSSNTDSFTNVKLDELSRNYCSNTDSSCFNSHHQQQQMHSKSSLSPHTPQSPRDGVVEYIATSPTTATTTTVQGHQPVNNEFVTDEFYIDESLPSSLSIETTGQSHGEFVRQLDTANNVVAMLQVDL